MRPVFAVASILLLLCTLVFGVPPWQQASHASGLPLVEQNQVKAVFLYNFLHFVSWPAELARPGQEQVIAILGDSPVQQALTDLVAKVEEKERIALRVLSLGPYREGMDLSPCHILFVGASEKNSMARIVASFRNRPVLTVADTESFLSAGGMIALLEQQNRIRYHINRKAASEAGLRLSSQLLKSAAAVQDE